MSKILWTQEASGWAQAFGGTVAIGVAFWVANFQHGAEERRRNLDDIRKLQVTKSIAGQIRAAITMIDEERSHELNIANRYTLEFLRSPERQLATLPLFEVPAARLIAHYTAIQRYVHEFDEALREDIEAFEEARRAQHSEGDDTDVRRNRLWDECSKTLLICREEIAKRE